MSAGFKNVKKFGLFNRFIMQSGGYNAIIKKKSATA